MLTVTLLTCQNVNTYIELMYKRIRHNDGINKCVPVCKTPFIWCISKECLWFIVALSLSKFEQCVNVIVHEGSQVLFVYDDLEEIES